MSKKKGERGDGELGWMSRCLRALTNGILVAKFRMLLAPVMIRRQRAMTLPSLFVYMSAGQRWLVMSNRRSRSAVDSSSLGGWSHALSRTVGGAARNDSRLGCLGTIRLYLP